MRYSQGKRKSRKTRTDKKSMKELPTGSQIMIVNGTDIDLVPDKAGNKQTGIFRIM